RARRGHRRLVRTVDRDVAARARGLTLAAFRRRGLRCRARRVARFLLRGHLTHDQRPVADLLVHLGELLATLLLRALLRAAHGVTATAGRGSLPPAGH